MSNVSINTNDSRYTGREGYSKPLDYYEEKLRRHQGAELLDHPDGSVTENKIAEEAVTTDKIAEKAVTGDKIGELTITADNIAHGAVQTLKIADGAITTDKIDNQQVTSDKLDYGAVKNENIGNKAVTEDKIYDKSISVSKLKDDFKLPGSMIEDNAVTEDKTNKEFLSTILRTTDKGIANGVATLNENGQVPSSQLPSYVDDVVEGYLNHDDGVFYEAFDGNPYVGEKGKIYVDIGTGYSYRWSGSQYIEIFKNEIPDDYIENKMLQDNCVTTEKIGADNINGEHIIENTIKTEHLSTEEGGVLQKYNNLISADNIDNSGLPTVINVGLRGNTEYVCNFKVDSITSTYGILTFEQLDGTSLISTPVTMLGTEEVRIYIDPAYDINSLIMVEGNKLLSCFIPYGESLSVNEELLTSVYGEISSSRLTSSTPRIETGGAGSLVLLSPNKIYDIHPFQNIVFHLVPSTRNGDQIVVRANIQSEIAINWGTTYFYGSEVPEITIGEYEFIFTYVTNKWVVGTLSIGQGDLL